MRKPNPPDTFWRRVLEAVVIAVLVALATQLVGGKAQPPPIIIVEGGR